MCRVLASKLLFLSSCVREQPCGIEGVQCAVENMFSIPLHLSLWADNECKYLFPLPLSLWAAKERVFCFSFLCRYGQIMNVFV